MELVYQYIRGIQALIEAGANVQTVVNACFVTVLSVEVDYRCLRVGYISAVSSVEQWAFVPLSTLFMVAFDDLPQEVI